MSYAITAYDKAFFIPGSIGLTIYGDTTESAIVKIIMTLAKSLDLTTIAEGVENETPVSFLIGLGCGLIQGHYFSRPLTVDDAGIYLIENDNVKQKQNTPAL